MKNANKIKERFSEINRGKIIFYLLLGLLLLLTITIFANMLDWKIDVINPPDKYHEEYIDLSYPQSSMIPIIERLPDGQIVNQPMFDVTILMNYSGDLVEGKRVDIIALGYVSPKGQKLLVSPENLTREVKYHDQHGIAHKVDLKYVVLAGFEGATIYNLTSADTGFSRGETIVVMEEVDDISNQPSIRPKTYYGQLPVQSIIWNSQGDHYPYLTFVDSNKTINRIQYADYKIHVSGTEVEKQDSYARINILLSFFIYILTIVMLVPILYRIYPEFFIILLGWGKKTDEDSPDITQSTSENKQPSPSKTQITSDKKTKKPR